MNSYEDIISRVYKKSKKYPYMSNNDRAAQFAPFQALSGYAEVVKEIARVTDEKIILDENKKEIINRKLLEVDSNIEKNIKVTIVFYEKDKLKKGGEYKTVSEIVKRIDKINKKIILINNEEIDIDNIIDIKI